MKFVSEKQTSVEADKYLTVFNRYRIIRPNPQINYGFDRKIELSLQYKDSPMELQIIPESGFLTDIELSNYNFKSDFNYVKVFFAGQFKTKTFYNELFVSPYLLINVEAGYISGSYGIQHIFSPVVSMGFYSPVTSFRGLIPYSYAGDKMLALHIEHNWRTIIFQALGLDFLTDRDIDIITGASAMRIINDSNYFPSISQHKPYWEVYAGTSRILGLLRLDFGYNSFKDFTLTLSTAAIF